MKTVTLVDDGEPFSLDEVAELIAFARYPGDDDRSKRHYQWALEEASAEVHNAANDGELKVMHPLTGMPLPPIEKHADPLAALFQERKSPEPRFGLVTIMELCRYVALRGIVVNIETPIGEMGPETAEGAPAASAANENSPTSGQPAVSDSRSLEPAVRDAKVLLEREKWQGSGRKAKDFDTKYSEEHGVSLYELKRRLIAARKRGAPKEAKPKTPKASRLDDVWRPKTSR